MIVWVSVSTLFAAPCFGTDRTGSNTPATQTQTTAALERMHLMLLEISAGEKMDLGDPARLGPYASVIQMVAKRMEIFRTQSMLLRQRIADARLDEALSIRTFRSSSTIQAVEARIESLLQDLDQYRSAVHIFFIQTPKVVTHSDASQAFKKRFLTGFTSTTRVTRKVSLGQVETMRKLAQHYVDLLTFLNAITGRYTVQGGHILFRDSNDLKVFRRDVTLIRTDYVAMNYFHRKRLEIIRNAMAKLKKANVNR